MSFWKKIYINKILLNVYNVSRETLYTVEKCFNKSYIFVLIMFKI